MDQYFELEEIKDPERVPFSLPRSWRKQNGRLMLRTCTMEEAAGVEVLKFEDSFLPGDVEADLLKKFQNLRQDSK